MSEFQKSGASKPGTGMSIVPVQTVSLPAASPTYHRAPPQIVPYVPHPSDGWSVRRQARKYEESLALATKIAEAQTKFYRAAAQAEQTAQELQRVTAQQQNLPTLIEVDRLANVGLLIDTAAFVEAKQEERARNRERANHAEEIENILRVAERRRALGELREAEMRYMRAHEIGNRRVDTDLARHDADRHRFVATSAEYLASIRKPRGEEPERTPEDFGPEAYRRRMAAEDEVGRIERRAAQDIADLEARCRAEGRDLNAEEIERRDAIRNAAAAAVSDVRRTGASDVR